MNLTRSQARKAELMMKRQDALKGHGMYIYENNTSGELLLPKPTSTGRRSVGVKEQFVGDSYYMYMLQAGLIRLIKEVSPQMPEKLITEVPPTITHDGTVEFVKQQPKEVKLNETDKQSQDEPVLLTENPLDGIKII